MLSELSVSRVCLPLQLSLKGRTQKQQEPRQSLNVTDEEYGNRRSRNELILHMDPEVVV